MKTLYLCGPITGTTFTESTTWRDLVSGELKASGIDCLSPLRGKDYLKDLGVLEQQYLDFPLSTGKAIVHRDRWDVMRADAVLANFLDASRVSIGSVMEIAWANMMHKPVIAVMEKTGNPHDHAFLLEAVSVRVETLQEALTVCRMLLL